MSSARAQNLAPSGQHRPRSRSNALRQRFRESADRWRERLSKSALQSLALAVRRRVGVTRAGQLGVVVAIGLWIAARIVAGTAMYLVAYGAVGLVVVSYFLAPRKVRLTGERIGLHARAQEGQTMNVELKLVAYRRSGSTTLEERLPERLGRPVKIHLPNISTQSEFTHAYGLRCSRRGVYKVGPLVAVASDPLGLYERESVVADEFELLVHPRVEQVSDRPLTRQFEDPPIRPPVSKPWPSGLEFYGMREYKPGDDLRRIVWRASARVGHLMVREAEQGITDHITIILDTDRGHHSRDPEGSSESFEMAVRAAASLGVRHLREGYEIRCETNTGPLTASLRGHRSQLQLLDALTRLEPSREPLTSSLMRLLASPRRDAHNILITPHLSREAAARTKLLLNTGVSILVVGLLWDESGEQSDVVGTAAALGCQVVGVHPGQDLTSALYHDIGAGSR